MSRGQRIGLIAVAVGVAIAAFVVLRAGEEEEQSPPASGPAETSAIDGSKEPSGGPEEQVDVTEIEVEEGAPVGGVQDLEVKKGEEVNLSVTSDAAAEVHVHGYDVFDEVEPGKKARLSFPAELDGVFEVELEETHTQIAELKVTP